MRKPLYTVKKSFLAALRLRLFIAFILTCAIGLGIFFASGMLTPKPEDAAITQNQNENKPTENSNADADKNKTEETLEDTTPDTDETNPEEKPEEPKTELVPKWLPEKLREHWLIIRIAAAALLPFIVLLIQLALIIRVKSFKIKIYENRIIVKEGILFATSEQQWCFTGVARFIIARNFLSHIIGISEIMIICPGGIRINERFIRHPNKLKKFLSTYFIGRKDAKIHLIND